MARKSKRESRKPMKTFVYERGKRRNLAKEVDALIRAMEDSVRRTDIAVARAKRSEEELRILLDRA
jgi:hypothetical protein